MDAFQQEEAIIMNDPKARDRQAASDRITAAERAETEDRAARVAAGRAPESGHPAPEALAGWLAA